jgi:Ni/Fe-hydrogenase 1 B-type cytochrome subunit
MRPAVVVREPVYVWDLVVRSTHWLIALGIIVLSVTGIYIGRPFAQAAGPTTDAFLMGWMRIVHGYTAMVFMAAVLARIAWMFIGPRYARWTEFIPVARARRRDMVGTFKFYTFLRPEPPPAVGHNPLAGLTYVFVFGLYLLMIVTGLALRGMSAHVDSYMTSFAWLLPWLGGAQTARWLHHVGMWLLLGFAVHHVYSAILMSKVEKNGTMDSIFGGWKVVKRGPHA